MYKSIALEVAQRNIRVNTIAPGFIKTFMTEKLNDIQQEKYSRRNSSVYKNENRRV